MSRLRTLFSVGVPFGQGRRRRASLLLSSVHWSSARGYYGTSASNLADLLKAKDAKIRPRENTVRHIRDVTNFDRNPLMHRNVSLEEIDATTLFNSALGVIVEMVKELIALDDADLQEALPLNGAAVVDLGLAPENPKRRLAASAPMKQISDETKSS